MTDIAQLEQLNQQPPSILCLDDEANVLKSLVRLLRQYKFDEADIQTQRRRFFFHFAAFVIGLHEIFERPYGFLSSRITTVAAYLQSNYEREG